MDTVFHKISSLTPDPLVIAEAGTVLKRGGLVAFPTETVYGLGASAYQEEALRNIYQAKGRPSDNPLILHIAELDMLYDLAETLPESAKIITKAFWPGPLTVIVPRSKRVLDVVTGGLDTVAVRFPSSLIAQQVIRAAQVPIAAPSANRSGRPSPTSAAAVKEDLDGKIDMIIDGGDCSVGVESTIVDCTTEVPTILRPGGITYEMLVAVLGRVDIDQGLSSDPHAIPKAPGMKYRHYAPAAPVLLFEGDVDKQHQAIEEQALVYLAQGKKVGLLVCDEWQDSFSPVAVLTTFGSVTRPKEIASRIFGMLRSFDHKAVDIILAQGIDEEGIGRAVMNRLRKAAGQKVIKV
jgi:L-threonylcarbamoyladenylate synthase